MAGKQAKMETGDYSPEFPLQWIQKDLQMASETAYEVNVPMPMANIAKEIYSLAMRAGLSESDFSAIFAYFNDDAG